MVTGTVEAPTRVQPAPLTVTIAEYGEACAAHGEALGTRDWEQVRLTRRARAAAWDAVLDAVMGPTP